MGLRPAIVEALACGAGAHPPTTPACPEAGGPGAIYVKAEEVASIRDGIVRLATDGALRLTRCNGRAATRRRLHPGSTVPANCWTPTLVSCRDGAHALIPSVAPFAAGATCGKMVSRAGCGRVTSLAAQTALSLPAGFAAGQPLPEES